MSAEYPLGLASNRSLPTGQSGELPITPHRSCSYLRRHEEQARHRLEQGAWLTGDDTRHRRSCQFGTVLASPGHGLTREVSARGSFLLAMAAHRSSSPGALVGGSGQALGMAARWVGAVALDRLRPAHLPTRLHPRLRRLRSGAGPQLPTQLPWPVDRDGRAATVPARLGGLYDADYRRRIWLEPLIGP